MSRCVTTKKVLGDGGSAGLRWLGRRYSWRPDAFNERNRDVRLRRVEDDARHHREKSEAQCKGVGFPQNLNGMLRRRMWLVMSVVAIVVSIIVLVEMNGNQLS